MKKVILFCLISTNILLNSEFVQAENNLFLFNKALDTKMNNSLFLQIFKEEGELEIYQQTANGQFKLFKTYPICKFSGGLGPKKQEGDLKSPEGFYQIDHLQLNPNSRYYRSINLGYPNEYDRNKGYNGSYLMIHGDCVSVGCYAMTDKSMGEIYQYVEAALQNGQSSIEVSIYPFRMSKANMSRHKNSEHYSFWQQLKPAYDYFTETGSPPIISIQSGQYLVSPHSPNASPKP